jgi:hypothetical protein
VGHEVGRAELLGEQAGEGLHLVAAGVQGDPSRLGGAHLGEARLQDAEGLLPGDLVEAVVAALGIGLAQERPGEARRGGLLHNPERRLGADHPVVERGGRVALDVADLAVAQGHPDPAPAGAL